MSKKVYNENTCKQCPHRFDRNSNGCPAWISETAGFMETNSQTGEERFITGCFYQVIPKLMVEVVKASNRPSAAVESMRNEMSEGMGKVFEVITRLPEIRQIQTQIDQNKSLEKHEEEDKQEE